MIHAAFQALPSSIVFHFSPLTVFSWELCCFVFLNQSAADCLLLWRTFLKFGLKNSPVASLATTSLYEIGGVTIAPFRLPPSLPPSSVCLTFLLKLFIHVTGGARRGCDACNAQEHELGHLCSKCTFVLPLPIPIHPAESSIIACRKNATAVES